ncbi:MAG: DMP19 family protein [Ruminococcus sp.]|nr:DMP19 family protein [Ruminococcus sp.]
MTKHYNINDDIIENDHIMDIIEPLWYGVSIHSGTYEEDLKRFTVPQKYVHAAMWYMGEVNNGGHVQFFDNDTGVVWKNALDGFKAMDFNEAEDILSQAAGIMYGSPEFDRKKRQQQLDSLTDEDIAALGELDDMFYRIKDFDDRVYRYILQNKKDFYFKGNIETFC